MSSVSPVARARAQVRSLVRPARYRARLATASARRLPDFVIAGAQKAGTTSLYAYLCTHPDVLGAGRKEVHYFDVNYARGTSWYRSMFPLGLGRSGAKAGEASPYYLFHPLAAERAAALIPDAKIVVLLRDPIERAWSHYRHEVAAGREPLSFADALAAEPERLAGADAALRAGGRGTTHAGHRYHSYVARGRYAEQLRQWYEHFPREQVLVLRAEDLFERPADVWVQTLRFLGLPDATPPSFEVHNPGAKSGMADDVRTQLTDTFRAPNQELEELLGRTFGWPT